MGRLSPMQYDGKEVRRWNVACDRRLDRLMAYLNSTVDHSLEAFVGDYIADIHVVHFSDADYASELRASKSP